ncbi:MAG: type II toxin-antitoxin system RelE family toxin [Devosia sp.]
MPLRIEWHPDAVGDLAGLDAAVQRRIKKTLAEIALLDDARTRLVPYASTLRGYWKLRVGDYRLVCRLTQRNGQAVLVVYVAHRSTAYLPRSVRALRNRNT